MFATSPRRASAVLALVFAATVGLAGCTGGTAEPASSGSAASPTASSGASGSSDGGQSTADACALVQTTINDATANFQDTAQSDPATLVTAMKGAADQLAATAPQVTNEEVAALLPELQGMFAQAADAMDAIAKNDTARLEELNSLSADYQTVTEKFTTLCAQ